MCCIALCKCKNVDVYGLYCYHNYYWLLGDATFLQPKEMAMNVQGLLPSISIAVIKQLNCTATADISSLYRHMSPYSLWLECPAVLCHSVTGQDCI